MTPEYTTEQKYLIDGIITDLTGFLMEDFHLKLNDALSVIYNSEYYNKLNNLDTELYIRSSLNNYHYLRHEIEYGA